MSNRRANVSQARVGSPLTELGVLADSAFAFVCQSWRKEGGFLSNFAIIKSGENTESEGGIRL
jgi:hypothetical protein